MNGTIFMYGQTGAGKTFTMLGDDENSAKIRGQKTGKNHTSKNREYSTNNGSGPSTERNKSNSKTARKNAVNRTPIRPGVANGARAGGNTNSTKSITRQSFLQHLYSQQ
jgi:hypothetical protein